MRQLTSDDSSSKGHLFRLRLREGASPSILRLVQKDHHRFVPFHAPERNPRVDCTGRISGIVDGGRSIGVSRISRRGRNQTRFLGTWRIISAIRLSGTMLSELHWHCGGFDHALQRYPDATDWHSDNAGASLIVTQMPLTDAKVTIRALSVTLAPACGTRPTLSSSQPLPTCQ